MKLTSNLSLEEFVPKSTWLRHGDNAIWFISKDIVLGAQVIRDYFNKSMSINTWHIKGEFQYRGYRPPEYTEGAYESDHRRGIAIDINIDGMLSDEVADAIIEKRDESFPWITCIEDPTYTKGWTHISTRWTNQKDLLIVKP